MPRHGAFDSSLAFLADPYRFITRECRRRHSDLFEARILLQPTVCMTGPRAAELFYDTARFARAGAMPEPLRATLVGKGGVQGLDGAAHRHRKAMFMALMTPQCIGRLVEFAAESWDENVRRWATQPKIVLYDALQPLLTRAVCRWAGVPLPEAELPRRSRELTAMFDGAGAIGARHLQSRLSRKRAEHWLSGLVEQVRKGRLPAAPGSPLQAIASHHDVEGRLLAPRVAAVELLNLLRPTVAITVFIVFAAHALHAHPHCRAKLQDGDEGDVERFVQEVRRSYPFFPAVLAKVREDFEWQGWHFPRGRRVMLDLHGSNHDPRSWDDPDAFRPERFRNRPIGAFELMPQGGADHAGQHRCAGEWITIALMKQAVAILARHLRYDVPPQDLRIDMRRLPALPRDRFVIADVRRIA